MENPARNARHATQPSLKMQRAKTNLLMFTTNHTFARDRHKLNDTCNPEKKKEGEHQRLPFPYVKSKF